MRADSRPMAKPERQASTAELAAVDALRVKAWHEPSAEDPSAPI